jgi:hypothetical protein
MSIEIFLSGLDIFEILPIWIGMFKLITAYTWHERNKPVDWLANYTLMLNFFN